MVSWNSTLQSGGKGSARAVDRRQDNANGEQPSSVETRSAADAAYLQALLENNPLGIVVLDLEGRVHTCNPAFETLFGYPMKEIRGVNLDSLLTPAEQAEEARRLTQRAARGEVVRSIGQRRRRDGQIVDVQIVGVPLEVGGKRSGSFAMYEDIS